MAKTRKGETCTVLAHKWAATHPAPNFPKKLRSWSDESMMGPLVAVKSGKMGLNRAALEFGIRALVKLQRTELQVGLYMAGTRSGPKPYLTSREEK